jgi:hypothetical protein
VSVESVNVSPEAHAFVADSAAECRKLPAVDASQYDTCDRVSDVPPFVHDGAVPEMAMEPADGAAWVMTTRVVEPAAAAFAPAAPGSPVCNFTYTAAGAVQFVALNRALRNGVAAFAEDSPTAIYFSFGAGALVTNPSATVVMTGFGSGGAGWTWSAIRVSYAVMM